MNEDETNLDLNWIENEEKIISIENGIFREQMKHIKIKYIYINCDSSIEAVDLEKYDLDANEPSQKTKQIISNDTLLKIVEKKRLIGTTKYKLLHILLFNVDLEPEEIQKYTIKIES